MAYDTQTIARESEKTAPMSLTKTCPRCGSVVFADMDVCYGCLYDFNRPSLDYPGSGSTRAEGSPAPVAGQAHAAPFPPAVANASSAPAMRGESVPSGSMIAQAPLEPSSIGTSAHATMPMPVSAQMPSSAGTPVGFAAGAAVLEAPSQAIPADAGSLPANGEAEDARLASAEAQDRFYLRVRWRGVEVLVPLEHGALTVGRLPQSDIVLSDFTVCDEHARIALSGERALVVLVDRRARATKDGANVQGSTELAAGEELDIAGARFALVRREGAGGK